jgi:hypothetical protein
MFGKAKCKLCGDNVRFVLRYLKEKHPETLKDTDVIKLNMSRIKKNFSDNSLTVVTIIVGCCNTRFYILEYMSAYSSALVLFLYLFLLS